MIQQITFDYDPDLDNRNLILIKGVAESIQLFYDEYQSVYAIHENTDYSHMHMIINNLPIGKSVQLSHRLNSHDIDLLASLCEMIAMQYDEGAKMSSGYISRNALDLMRRYKQHKLTMPEYNIFFQANTWYAICNYMSKYK